MKILLIKLRGKWKILIILVLMTTVVFGTSYKKPPTENWKNKLGHVPEVGFVPNKITAVKIAEAVWLPIYGESIYKKRPYKVRLDNDVWIVEGVLPLNHQGGVPYIEIQKKDGKILKVLHSK